MQDLNLDLNLFVAFGAGVLTFISPCTLPIYPAFLSYITGISVKDLKDNQGMLQKRSMLHTLFFLLGFSVIYIALGFSTSLVGDFFSTYRDVIRQIGALVMIFMGLILSGLIKPSFLLRDMKFTFENRPSGYIGTFLIGLAFAAGWTPCSGPIIASVISLAAINPESGMVYMLAYVIGFAIPFFILAFFMNRLSWIRNHSEKITKIGGYIMIVLGLVLFFDLLVNIIAFFNRMVNNF